MFFSPLWLLNFEVLLKLLFPLQSYKRNYSLLSSIISVALFYTLKSLIHLEFNLWLNFVFLHCFLYQLLIVPLICPLICRLYHTLSSQICIFGFISELYILLTSLFIHLQHTFVEMKYGLYYLLKLIFPHCSFSVSLAKIFTCFFKSEFY